MPLLVLPLFVPVAASQARTISWSGYNWDVRPAASAQEPGPNDWSDSAANVQVQGSDLVLSIVSNSAGQWTSSEVDNQTHLGYGTYRWVVATDLSTLDANEVLGMFTYGGSDPSNNEIDIEASHWGNLSNPTGSATVWQNASAGLSAERDFGYSNRPPYVNEFTWSPGRIDYLVTDASGATLLAWTVTTGVPTPSTEVPVINYWRSDNVAPAGVRTMRISSFAWVPLGQSLPPVTNPAGPASTPGGTGTKGTGSPRTTPPLHGGRERLACVVDGWSRSAAAGRAEAALHLSLSMTPNRFPIGRLWREGVLRWTSTRAAIMHLIIQRWARGSGFVRIGALWRVVHSGRGRIRLPHQLDGHPMGPGTYRVGLAFGARSARCAPDGLQFTVT